jgi:hypothetical protein
MKRTTHFLRGTAILILSITVLAGCWQQKDDPESAYACEPATNSVASPANEPKTTINWEKELTMIKQSNESKANVVDLSIEFGPYGDWDGKISLTGGTIKQAAAIDFEPGSGIVDKGDDFVTIQGKTDYGMNGVRLLATVSPDAKLNVHLASITMEVAISDVLKSGTISRTAKGKDNYPNIGIAVRRTDYKAQRYNEQPYDMPAAKYTAAPPRHVIFIPGNGTELGNERHSLEIELDRTSPEQIDYRRLTSRSSDRLCLQIFTGNPDDEKDGKNGFSIKQVTFQREKQLVQGAPASSIYLDVPAFIGYYDVKVGKGDNWRELQVPATSIVLDGPKMMLNGDPFLAKGTLVQWGNWNTDVQPADTTSFLMKNMGINTVSSPPSSYYEPWGYASIRRTEPLTIAKKTVQEDSVEKFLATRDELVGKVPASYREYISSPMDLATFFSNETTNRGNAWTNYLSPNDQFARLDSYLAYMYNAAKKVSPMMPVSYANHMPWYRPISWLDMIMYNSYYTKDRYPLPLSEYAKWQGFPEKPIYHKEYGSNTYLDEIYQGGRNNPVFGKIREWAMDKRWQEYMSIGSLGGGVYDNFDYKVQKTNDGNTTSFGIFTQDQEPKQAAYTIWRDYTDLVFHEGGIVENRREYPLRHVNLMIYGEDGPQLEQIDVLEPGQKKQLQLPDRFYWTAQFSTHGGLLNQQSGACPDDLFRRMFDTLLPADESLRFARELLASDVIGWDGATDDYLMGKFEQNNVIAVAFRKAPGEYYLTAWVQKDPNAGAGKKSDTHSLTFFDTGDVRALDDITGAPLDGGVKYEEKDGKLVFRDLELPLIGRSISQRSKTPIKLPVFQVSKSGFAELAAGGVSPAGAPDQFQLWHDGTASLGDGQTEAVGQRFGSLRGNLRSVTVMPLADTGSPKGDVRVVLYAAGEDGMPAETIAERAVNAALWQQSAGKPLTIDFGAALAEGRSYIVTLASAGDPANHRNVAVSGTGGVAITPSYGGGAALILRGGQWQVLASGKESLFFVTTADVEK